MVVIVFLYGCTVLYCCIVVERKKERKKKDFLLISPKQFCASKHDKIFDLYLWIKNRKDTLVSLSLSFTHKHININTFNILF